MRPRDWFSVGTRLFGLYVCLRGFAYLLLVLADSLSLLTSSDLSREWETARAHRSADMVFAGGYIGLGFILVYGAERITRLAYNEPAPERPSNEYAEDDSDSE